MGDDWDLWDKIKKDVKPLKKRDKQPSLPKVVRPYMRRRVTVKDDDFSIFPQQHTKDFVDQKKSTSRSGKIHIYATLDLHGYNLEHAFKALNAFLLRNQQTESVWVLVITGKGKTSASFEYRTIREMFVYWINADQFASVIGEYRIASPVHGGEGAFYVRLKRKRT